MKLWIENNCNNVKRILKGTQGLQWVCEEGQNWNGGASPRLGFRPHSRMKSQGWGRDYGVVEKLPALAGPKLVHNCWASRKSPSSRKWVNAGEQRWRKKRNTTGTRPDAHDVHVKSCEKVATSPGLEPWDCWGTTLWLCGWSRARSMPRHMHITNPHASWASRSKSSNQNQEKSPSHKTSLNAPSEQSFILCSLLRMAESIVESEY